MAKLSLTTWCYRDLPGEEAIRRIGDWDVEGIELIAHAPSFHVRVDFSDEEVDRTRELLAEYGLAISAISPHTEFLQFDEGGRAAEIAHTKATVDLCLRLGADHVVDSSGKGVLADVMDLTHGQGVDKALDLVTREDNCPPEIGQFDRTMIQGYIKRLETLCRPQE